VHLTIRPPESDSQSESYRAIECEPEKHPKPLDSISYGSGIRWHQNRDNTGVGWNGRNAGVKGAQLLALPRLPSPEGGGRGIRAWYVDFGIPFGLVAIGLGLAMVGGTFFWPGIGLASAGLVWLLADLWIIAKTLSIWDWSTDDWIVVAWLAFKPAPLEVFSLLGDAHYT